MIFESSVHSIFRNENKRRHSDTVALVGVHIHDMLHPCGRIKSAQPENHWVDGASIGSMVLRLCALGIHGMDPLSDFDLWFPPSNGSVGLDEPLQYPREPEQVLSIPGGMSALFHCQLRTRTLMELKHPSRHRRAMAVWHYHGLSISREVGTTSAVNKEVRPGSNLVVPFESFLNLARDNSFDFAPPSTLFQSDNTSTNFSEETKAVPRFPVFTNFFGHCTSDEPNKGKPTVGSDVVFKHFKVTNTSSTGPVSFNGGNSNNNASPYPNYIGSHLVSACEQSQKEPMSRMGCSKRWLSWKKEPWRSFSNQITSCNCGDLDTELESITPRSRIDKEHNNPGSSTGAAAACGNRRDMRHSNHGRTYSSGIRAQITDPFTLNNLASIPCEHSSNSAGHDFNPQTSVAEQPILQNVTRCHRANSYVNRVYFSYMKRRAKMESANIRNHRKKVDTLEGRPDLEKNEKYVHANKKS